MSVLNVKMRMSELVERDCHLLDILSRVGISAPFGGRSVSDICLSKGLDPETILLLCNVCSFPDYSPRKEELRRGHISDVLRYLHHSHDYYVNQALVRLESDLDKLILPCGERYKKVMWKFFSEYRQELERHFSVEENEVIPYVQRLLIGSPSPKGFSIDDFDEAHTGIEEKLSDLRSLLMNSLPGECDPVQRLRVLEYMFSLREDFKRHTRIEDDVLAPMVRLLENPESGTDGKFAGREDEDEGREELSDREKEILVSVASGMLNKEIADKHSISINTVITHRKNITRKTGIKTVAGLTVYAILNNLIDISSVE